MSHENQETLLLRSLSRRNALKLGGAGIASAIGASSIVPVARAEAEVELSPLKDVSDEETLLERVSRATADLDDIVHDAMSRTGAPGLAVGVVYRDEMVYLKGFGVRQAGTSDVVDENTVFQIASLSKPVATTVVAGLVGDGVIDWDTRLADVMPEFRLHDPLVTRDVTLRDMFSHQSGLPGHAGDTIEDLGYDRREVLHRLRYMKPAASLRGAYAYTNFGFTAAAEAATVAAGTNWEALSEDVLYVPAGMSRTSSRFADFIAYDNRAHGHVQRDGVWSPEYVRQPDAQSPAGGVSSTIYDMSRFMRLHLAGGWLGGDEIIPGGSLGETHRPQVISGPPADPATDRAGFYGLGWNVSYDAAGRVRLGHSGAFALGCSTAIFLVPAWDVGICVLTNVAPIGLGEAIGISFLDIVETADIQNDYVEIFQQIFAAEMAPWYEVVEQSPPPDQQPSLDPTAYVGHWVNDLFGPAEVVATGDTLELHIGPEPQVFALVHHTRDIFVYRPEGENAAGLSAVTFTVDRHGRAVEMTIDNLNTTGQGRFTRRNVDE